MTSAQIRQSFSISPREKSTPRAVVAAVAGRSQFAFHQRRHEPVVPIFLGQLSRHGSPARVADTRNVFRAAAT